MLYMNIDGTWQTESFSSEDTSALGEQLGRACKGGEVFLLVSDLGGGKTTFVQGLARGLDSAETVGSPTYTIVRVYKCRDDMYLHHFDFYRLKEPGLVAHELTEVIDDPKAVVAIEWGEKVSEALPSRLVTITLDRTADSDKHRHIIINYPQESAYLMKDLL
jgi:tRNA threonylcarbamoyladenosine biosynthesis protein TsaE